MSRTIHYYNIYITRNGVKTSIPIDSLVDSIYPLNDPEKFWNRKKLSLLYLRPIDVQNPIKRYNRSMAIAKYRETYKPYTGRIGTNIARPINDDVIEFTNGFFIGNSRQIAIEYNHIGSRPNEIAEYLSSFLPKNNGNYWSILLEPIETNIGMSDIRNADRIYSIEFSIDCSREIGNTFETESFFGSFLDKTIESHQVFGANVATIRFGNGRKRINVIEAERLVNLLHHLDFEDDIFASVKVEYDSPDTGRRERVDLKNHNVLKSIILENDDSTGYEFILDSMENKYYMENRPGSRSFLRFEDQLEYHELPEINSHNPPIATEAGA